MVACRTRNGRLRRLDRFTQFEWKNIGLPNLELTVITDQAGYIRASVSEVLRTALYGGGLAILVLFLFLRSWKTTVIIGIAIPISVVATFFLMYVSGISLNIMSLGGLTLGIGLLVDNSIVVLESIQRRRDRGADDVEAARAGTDEVGRAVVASTLTTICVFVPIVFVEGIAGQLFGDQALTVTYSLVISLIVALSVIPMLASRRFAPRDEEQEDGVEGRAGVANRAGLRAAVGLVRLVKFISRGVGRVVGALSALPLRLFQLVLDAVAALYRRQLDWVLAHPLITVAVAFLMLAGSLTLPEDSPSFRVEY